MTQRPGQMATLVLLAVVAAAHLSLAPAVAAIALLLTAHGSRLRLNALLAGLLFGIALQMKLLPVILLPIGALAIALRRSNSPKAVPAIIADLLVLSLTAVLSFVAMDLLIERGAFLAHFQQS